MEQTTDTYTPIPLERSLVVLNKQEEVTAPSAVKPEPEPEIAYTVRDTLFQPFRVKKVSHAWWLDSRKVDRLIEAFKSGLELKECYIHAGITRGQYEYFKEQHPEFSGVKEACESAMIFVAIDSVNNGLRTDPKLAMQYLKVIYPKFRDKLKVDIEQPLNPTTNEPIATGAVDTTEVTKALEGFSRDIIARRGGKGNSSSTS